MVPCHVKLALTYTMMCVCAAMGPSCVKPRLQGVSPEVLLEGRPDGRETCILHLSQEVKHPLEVLRPTTNKAHRRHIGRTKLDILHVCIITTHVEMGRQTTGQMRCLECTV